MARHDQGLSWASSRAARASRGRPWGRARRGLRRGRPVRAAHDRPGDREALLLAEGKASGAAVLEAAEADALQCIGHLAAARVSAKARLVGEVLGDRVPAQQRRHVEDAADALPGPMERLAGSRGRCRSRSSGGAGPEHTTGWWSARPVRPEQAEDLARSTRRSTPFTARSVVLLDQADDLEGRRAGRAPLRSPSSPRLPLLREATRWLGLDSTEPARPAGCNPASSAGYGRGARPSGRCARTPAVGGRRGCFSSRAPGRVSDPLRPSRPARSGDWTGDRGPRPRTPTSASSPWSAALAPHRRCAGARRVRRGPRRRS